MMKEQALTKMKEVMHAVYSFENHLIKEHGLLLNAALTLCALEGSKSKRSSDLAEELGVTYSLMSRTVVLLEKRLLIDRSIGKTDKREMRFTLTEKGKKLLKEIREGYDLSKFLSTLKSR